LYKAPQFPLTLGREAAGTVVNAHPSVTGFENGTRVVFMGNVNAYAQYSVVNASDAVVIPDDIPTEQAVAAYLQGLTAWTFIREAGQVKEGQWVLVHAASGGVGTLLVQLLRTVGAKVIGTASSDEKLALAKKNGAEWVINSHDDVVAKVKEITGGHGADVIFDGVGKVTFDGDLEMIAPKGNLISFGNAVSDQFNNFYSSRTDGYIVRCRGPCEPFPTHPQERPLDAPRGQRLCFSASRSRKVHIRAF
jgi:NADPH2:quinone reductase